MPLRQSLRDHAFHELVYLLKAVVRAAPDDRFGRIGKHGNRRLFALRTRPRIGEQRRIDLRVVCRGLAIKERHKPRAVMFDCEGPHSVRQMMLARQLTPETDVLLDDVIAGNWVERVVRILAA